MKKLLILSMLVVLGATSCASIVNGSNQTVKINSNSSQALIRIYDSNNNLVTEGTGNLEASLRRAKANNEKENYKVTVTSNGRTQTFGINSELSMWYPIGNLGFGGIPGWIIDTFSAAKYKLRTTDGKNPSNGINVDF